MRLENAQQAARGYGLSRPNDDQEENRQPREEEAKLSPTQMDDRREDRTVQPAAATKARSISNLFRSKSLRIISSNGNHPRSRHKYQPHQQTQDHNQAATSATIDYLSTARPHKRSLSINRNSSNLFSSSTTAAATTTSGSSDTLSQKNFIASSGGGKLVLFLRRLFRTKRSSKSTRGKFEADTDAENMRHSSLDNSRIIINNIHTTTTTSNDFTFSNHNNHNNNNNNNSSGGADETTKQRAPQLRQRAVNLLSSPSPDSSGSNSLIEILDCSPAVNQSRRVLREQHLARERNRASWRMQVQRRSDSSLSELSDCSTTASEQLRRHLDEAYKRHRNCTSQREKEFIDSINVLRQASRHALPQSAARSPSKTRYAASKSVASGKSDIETTSSLAGSQSTAGCTELDLRCNEAASLRHEHMQLQPQVHHQHPNCCPICASYLDSVARLCPLAAAAAATTYCPATATASPSTCCPVLVHSAAPPPLSSPSHPADMCMCPLWRSMISNYSSGCQSADSPPPLIFNPMSAAAAAQSHHQHHQSSPSSLALAQQQQQLLITQPTVVQNSLLPSQQQHQQKQHHNTTIDLKIEIGAELSKQTGLKLAGTNNRRSFSSSNGRKHHHHHQQHPKVVVAEADSLDSDYTTTTSTTSASSSS